MKKRILHVSNVKLGIVDKIVLVTVSIIILLSIVFIQINADYYAENSIEFARTSMEKISDNLEVQLQCYMDDKVSILKYMATYPDIYEMDRKKQREFLLNRAELVGFHHTFVMDMEGEGYYIEENAYRYQKGEVFFDNIMKNEIYITEPFYEWDHITTTMTICVSIYDTEGEKVGVLCGALELSNLQNIIARNQTLSEGEFFIVNRNGEFITADNAEVVYSKKSVYDTKDSELTLLKTAFENRNSEIGTIEMEGKEYQACITYVEDFDWAIVQYISTDVVLKNENRINAWQFIMWAGMVILLLCIIRIIYCWRASGRRINMDSLTKCYSRSACEEIINRLNKRKKNNGAILYMDLNYFKTVNDTYGHDTGDKLLCVFSKVLMQVFGKNGFVGRMGGDEFVAVLLNHTEDSIQKLWTRVEQELSEEAKALKLSMNITASLGYAFFTAEGKEDINKVLHRADKAMYANKQDNR